MEAQRLLCQFSGFYCQQRNGHALELIRRGNWRHFPFKCLTAMPSSYYYGKKIVSKRNGIRVLSPRIMSTSTPLELLEAWDDEYNGVVIDSEGLPLSSANAFAGFSYHQAEPGYVMLTYWIPEEPCLLLASPSHQIGIAAFVINDNRQWIRVEEVLGQQFYEEDEMLRKIMEICMDAYDSRYRGFTAQQFLSKFDGKLSYFYYKNPNFT